MRRIVITAFGVSAIVDSDWSEMLDILAKDFWSFLSDETSFKPQNLFRLKIKKSGERPVIPEVVASMQTKNAISYDDGSKRYCDYYGQAYSEINFETNEAILCGEDFNRVHEIAYLLILSRIGKALDLAGLHKLHAFAISFKGIAFVCMMPSQGGKSTLLMELLKDERIKMISDDIPLVDSLGRIHPFPLKIGLNDGPQGLEVINPSENVYHMRRAHYGDKVLVSTKGLPGKVESFNNIYHEIVLAEAFRYNSGLSILKKSTILTTLKGLFKHGVIGLGSPIILEYFWQNTWKDFAIKTWIFFRRLSAFTVFSLRADRVKIHLGRNPVEASRMILKYLEKKSGL